MTVPATFATTLPAAILETILSRLAMLFLIGAGGDTAAARQAALQMLTAYHPETEDELGLAANIIAFSFHALEALSQSAAPDVSMTRILRLRGSAVSLGREAEKARRSLARAQKARQQDAAPKAEPATIETPPAEPLPDTNRVHVAAKAQGLTWTQAYQQRQRQARLAASQKKAEARLANLPASARPAPSPAQANAR